MKTINLLLCAGTIAAFTGAAAASAELWLNELHYDNAGGDVDEGLEIAANFEIDISLLSVYAYNGSNGTEYSSWSNTIFNTTTVAGGSLAWFTGQGSLQNGAPDGLAIYYDGALIQFLSYEGSPFTATDGPAAGELSTDLGISESSSSPVGSSLQLTGTGESYSDFTWTGGETATWGSLNPNQTIGAIPAPGALALLGLAGIASRRRRR